jgi:hypothetical protein
MPAKEMTAQKLGRHLTASFLEKFSMVDAEEAKLKAEIDVIVTNIKNTMKKIERVVPLKPMKAEQSEEGEGQKIPAKNDSR